MNRKEVRKLSRLELIELLSEQSAEIDRLNAELETAKKQLENRKLVCNETGNIAQAVGSHKVAARTAREATTTRRLIELFKVLLYFRE